ncbi:D-alanyl-D-alanine carboxypeptidase/D-alanyl-D-alanine-endopeptidase [Phytoactinopolyspora endophytica]|uniref:D-alanyl-D-alanine carboxypeptidase/D-alanyl-D-alanine endopeptidase n=1 Tax=Phytoactinopolyspora endophytica TaxID=1642495 RepID=UPI00101C162E|nr:D-alanyl-D-alanine carboxypeptidase/D-alanyl-D-alanine-endopeptidase [Phytoactinopolyspora endophytica]
MSRPEDPVPERAPDRRERRRIGRRGLRARTAALAVAGVAAAGALAGVALYGAGVLPPSSDTAGKVSAALPAEAAPPSRWEPAGTVLESSDTSDADQANSSEDGALGEVLDSLAGASVLGGSVSASVVNLSADADVYESNAAEPLTPASTMKLVTSAAVLEVLGPEHRFSTEVVMTPGQSGDAEITLVGGGDPVLASAADAVVMPSASSLEALASRTAEALEEAGVTSVRLSYDDSLFSGPGVDPDWRTNYVPDGVAGPVNALSVDGARREPGLRDRVDDPALASAEQFAGMLDGAGVSVSDDEPERARAEAEAEQVAAVDSPPLSAIVGYTLRTSDNDAAEAMARHVALGLDRPGSSADAEESVTEVLSGLGVDVDGLNVADGSGLARGNTVTAGLLVSLLTVAADAERPHLRPVISGLPVAGFDGTLAERSADGSAGYVRAKTGTLTGVHSLAGVAVARDGTTYAFAILADDADDALGARAALDEFAAALSRVRG